MTDPLQKIKSTIEIDASKVLHWLTSASSELAHVAPQVQALAIASLQTVIKAIGDASAAVSDGGVNLLLDEQLVADARAIVTQFEADLKTLGITL